MIFAVCLPNVFTDAAETLKDMSVELPSDTTHMTEGQMKITFELKRLELEHTRAREREHTYNTNLKF